MVFIPVRDEHGIKLGDSFGILLGSEVEGSREGIYEFQNIVRCLVGIVTTVDQHCREHKRVVPDGLAIWPVSRKLNQRWTAESPAWTLMWKDFTPYRLSPILAWERRCYDEFQGLRLCLKRTMP